jgi:hypothetical protein
VGIVNVTIYNTMDCEPVGYACKLRVVFYRRFSTLLPLLLLAGIVVVGLWCRLEQRAYFADHSRYLGITAFHLATSRATAEGKPFHYVAADKEAATKFINERENSFTESLSTFDEEAERLRQATGDRTYIPYFGDQSGWGIFVFLARLVPGVDSLSDVSLIQILIDIGALLLLYPLGIFVTGRKYLALGACALYAVYLPGAYAAAEPFREAWPGFAVIYSMGLMLPVWKRGPEGLLRSLGWLVAAGVLIGLFTYGRTTAVTTPVTLAVITFFCWRRFWPAAVAGATVTAAMLVTLGPWMAVSYANEGVVSVTSSGSGHSFLTGLGEEPNNRLGIRFDDTHTVVYIRNVCGYDVEYGTYAYSAACQQEARRFVSDNKSWYATLIGKRILQNYVYRKNVPRLQWGLGIQIPLNQRGLVERYLPPVGILGTLLGFFFFPRAWIPLLWVVHFWAFIFPMQAHPRLFLGADWALCMGVAMLLGGLVLLALKGLRAVARRTVRETESEALPSAALSTTRPATARPPKRGLLALGVGVLAVDLTVLALLMIHAPAAPPPTNDWRAGFRSSDLRVQIATLEGVARWGVYALPVLQAGSFHDDRRVRHKATEVFNGIGVTKTRVDFARGSTAGLHPYPDVKVAVQRDSQASNGYFGRVTAARGALKPLFVVPWLHSPGRGDYRISFRARSSEPLALTFYSGGLELRQRQNVRGVSYPMKDFKFWEIPYRNVAEDDTVLAVFQQRHFKDGRAGTVIADFDWIEVRKEVAVEVP